VNIAPLKQQLFGGQKHQAKVINLSQHRITPAIEVDKKQKQLVRILLLLATTEAAQRAQD
jgi:hypothetical protein